MSDINTVELESKTSEVLNLANVSVVDQASYNLATDAIKTIKAFRKEIKSTFRPAIDAAHKAHKAVMEAMKKHDKPLEDAETKLKKISTAWYSEQERLRILAENKARREAEEAARAEAALGLVADEPMKAPEPIAKTEADGISYRETWKFEVQDSNAVPRDFCIPDETKIRLQVQSLKGLTSIPGIRVWVEKTPIVR